MQNIEKTETKKMSKQEYNKLYYQRNKEKWASQKSQSKANVFQLFGKTVQKPLEVARKTSRLWGPLLRAVEILLLAILIGIITAFLIKEAAGFYLDAQDTQFLAYLKASLIEFTVILLSVSRSNQRLIRFAQRLVLVMLCAFTLFVMSGKVVKVAVGETTKVQSVTQTIQQMESELTQKEQFRAQLLARGWIGGVRRYDKSLDQLRNLVITYRQELANLQPSQIVLSHLVILISFRLILVMANLVLFHLILEKLGQEFVESDGENRLRLQQSS